MTVAVESLLTTAESSLTNNMKRSETISHDNISCIYSFQPSLLAVKLKIDTGNVCCMSISLFLIPLVVCIYRRRQSFSCNATPWHVAILVQYLQISFLRVGLRPLILRPGVSLRYMQDANTIFHSRHLCSCRGHFLYYRDIKIFISDLLMN